MVPVNEPFTGTINEEGARAVSPGLLLRGGVWMTDVRRFAPQPRATESDRRTTEA